MLPDQPRVQIKFIDCLSYYTRYIHFASFSVAMKCLHNGMWFTFIGSHAAFQRVYEDPIVLSRQPSASPEEKEIGETRANEVWKDAS